VGISEHPGRRPLSAQFDAIKAVENALLRDRIEAKPQGQRFEAASAFRDRIEALRREQAEAEDAEQVRANGGGAQTRGVWGTWQLAHHTPSA
jgi:hypothetical protein